jgi:hypothetical protein
VRFFYLLFPLAPVLVSFVHAIAGIFKRSNINIIFILIATMLALINYTREPTSDLENYYSIFELLKGKDYAEFFSFVRIDYLFYFISMLIVKVFNTVQVTMLFWTFISYFIYFKSLELINKNYLNSSQQTLILALLFSITMGLLFNHSSHLVRGFVAVSILLYSIVLTDIETASNKKAIVCFIIASLIHFSVIIFLPLLLIRGRNKSYFILLAPILVAVSYFIGQENILLILSQILMETNYSVISEIIIRINEYVYLNNGDIQLGEFIKLSGFFLISWILLLYSNKYNLLSSSFIYLMMILILFRNTDLVLIRYFFYAQFFYGLFILIILQELNNKFISTIFLFYVLYGISRFFNNIINGNWQYVSNDVSLLYLNIFDYLTFW